MVIQAKVESDSFQSADAASMEITGMPASVKKEIIDECLEKLKEYIDRQVRDDRR